MMDKCYIERLCGLREFCKTQHLNIGFMVITIARIVGIIHLYKWLVLQV